MQLCKGKGFERGGGGRGRSPFLSFFFLRREGRVKVWGDGWWIDGWMGGCGGKIKVGFEGWGWGWGEERESGRER